MSPTVATLKVRPVRSVREGGSVAELQRRRLLAATAGLVEGGRKSVNVAGICTRAGVSRRTFYELFEDRDACLLAAFLQALERAESAVVQAMTVGDRWRSRMRAGLRALLEHLDREPADAWLLVVESLRAGEGILEERRRALVRLAFLVDGARMEAKRQPPSLTSDGVVGAVLSIVQGRVLSRDPHPLSELTGPLTAMIVQPYFGLAAAQREIEASSAVSASIAEVDQPSENMIGDAFKGMRLTYRTAMVLRSIAEHPGSSNRQIADAAGISDPGQTSRLLARLERCELAHNSGGESRRGEAKAWSLTSRGEEVLRVVGEG